MKHILWIIASVLCTGLLWGCQGKPVAIVNGEKITEKMLETALNEKLAEHKMQGAEVSRDALRRAVLEQLITNKLLLQTAIELGILATDDEVEKEIEAAIKGMGKEAFNSDLKARGLSINDFKIKVKEGLVLARVADRLVQGISVEEKEIRDFYKQSSTPFIRPEMVFVRFIQTQTEEQARAILKEINDKAVDFDRIADRVEKEKSAIVSQYGWTQPEFFGNSQIASGLRNINKGACAGPYKGKDAYFIFSIKDRQPQRPETLNEAGDKIRAMLLEGKRQAAVADWIAEKKSRSNIIVN